MEYDDNKKTTKKRLFRRSCNNYDLNSDFLLRFKYKNKYEKGKSKTIDRHKLKKTEEYELRLIPTVNNVIGLLDNLHKEVNHQAYIKLKLKIDELKIYNKGIYKDIKKIKISDLCDVCIRKKVVFYKREPSKQIIMRKPKERFIMNLTYLTVELIEGNIYKYVFNIMDHFSKFLISYLIQNKDANTILEKLKLCFDTFGYPEQVGCDNGTEFILIVQLKMD